jgi:predicted  nucleic acid-binding Zn-ribbon protein
MMRKVVGLLVFLLLGTVFLSFKFPRVEYLIRDVAGQEKHDIFSLAMGKANAQQVRTKEEFSDALQELQHSLKAGEGNQSTTPEDAKNPDSPVERYYNQVSSKYHESENAVNDFRARIQELNDQSKALFTEWEKEAGTMPSNSDIRSRSLRDLEESKAKYDAVYKDLERSLQKAEITLKSFRDYTYALKHLVNAETIGKVDGEYRQLSSDIEDLIRQMDSSIKSTREYLNKD